MSAGLLASTVTPGITAPVVSFTTPAIPVAWAKAAAGNSTANDQASTTPDTIPRISSSWLSVLRTPEITMHSNEPEMYAVADL